MIGSVTKRIITSKKKEKEIHGSRETRLETEFSASVGTPPTFKDQGANAAPKSGGNIKRVHNSRQITVVHLHGRYPPILVFRDFQNRFQSTYSK